jgi:hypothetical protein
MQVIKSPGRYEVRGGAIFDRKRRRCLTLGEVCEQLETFSNILAVVTDLAIATRHELDKAERRPPSPLPIPQDEAET